MKRIVLFLLALGLAATAAAGDFLQATAIQQSTLQLRADVAALRNALTQPGVNAQSTLSTYAPALLERARAARAQATAFREKIELQLESAEQKRLAAEEEYYLKNVEAAIQTLVSTTQQISAASKKLDEIAQMIEEILPRLQALVAGACTLPHASTTIVKNTCAIAACERGYLNADGNPANGCEALVR